VEDDVALPVVVEVGLMADEVEPGDED